MPHDHRMEGLPLRTGDILCLRDGRDGSLYGTLWKGIGALVPGEIDHCAQRMDLQLDLSVQAGSPPGTRGRPLVADFGIARALSQ